MIKYELNQDEANKFVLNFIKKVADTNNPFINVLINDDNINYQIIDDFYYDSSINKKIISLSKNSYQELLMLALISCGINVDYIKSILKRKKVIYQLKVNKKQKTKIKLHKK